MARKQSYRQTAIQRCVYLKALDGKPVTVEERKYADMALDQSEAGLAAQAAAQQLEAAQGGAKVPIKVTSMNFEALVVPGLGGAQLGMESLAVGSRSSARRPLTRTRASAPFGGTSRCTPGTALEAAPRGAARAAQARAGVSAGKAHGLSPRRRTPRRYSTPHDHRTARTHYY